MFQDSDHRAPRSGPDSGTVLLDRMSQEVASLLGEAAAQQYPQIQPGPESAKTVQPRKRARLPK